MINCLPTGTNIPELLQSEPCDGIYTSDSCIIHPQAITALNLPVNSSLNTIITALVLGLQYKEEQIQELIARIEVLETP